VDALLQFEQVRFPQPMDVVINMMPIITGDASSVPRYLHGYLPLIAATGLAAGKLSYLTVHESFVLPGQTQRRRGVHTDGTVLSCWGGGWGGGDPQPKPEPQPEPTPPKKPDKGIYMASTDGRCHAWNVMAYDVDEHGAIANMSLPLNKAHMLAPETLYWMTDRTPHESLPSLRPHFRQFFRLVADDIGVWWARHSTANPFGVQPNCRIEYGSKF